MLGKSWHETAVKRLSAAGLTHALHTPYTRLRPHPSGFNTESMRHTGASAENRTDRPTGGSEPPFSPLAPRAPPRHAPAPATRRGRDVKPVGALAPAGRRGRVGLGLCRRQTPARPRPTAQDLEFSRSLGDSRARRRSRSAGGGPHGGRPVSSERSYNTIQGRRRYLAVVN